MVTLPTKSARRPSSNYNGILKKDAAPELKHFLATGALALCDQRLIAAAIGSRTGVSSAGTGGRFAVSMWPCGRSEIKRKDWLMLSANWILVFCNRRAYTAVTRHNRNGLPIVLPAAKTFEDLVLLSIVINFARFFFL